MQPSELEVSARVERRGVADIAGMSVPYAVIRSRRAKHVRLRIRPRDGVEIVVPVGIHISPVHELLHIHERWIARHVQMLTPLPQAALRDGVRIKFQGETLCVSVTRGRRVAAERRGDVLELTVETETDVAPMVDAWFRLQARLIFHTMAQSVAQSMNLQFSGITVRDQRSRWGSCSNRSALSFSWRLVLAPAEVMQYIVVHEVAHLREHNHGSEFWALVEKHCPDYRKHRRWLRENGATLRSVVAEESGTSLS